MLKVSNSVCCMFNLKVRYITDTKNYVQCNGYYIDHLPHTRVLLVAGLQALVLLLLLVLLLPLHLLPLLLHVVLLLHLLPLLPLSHPLSFPPLLPLPLSLLSVLHSA